VTLLSGLRGTVVLEDQSHLISQMADKIYLLRFRPPILGTVTVVAARAEIQGEHLVLLNSDGELAALYLLDLVESWSEVPGDTPNYS
jgi:hypothetical protein